MNRPTTYSCGALDKPLHLESHLRCWAAKGHSPAPQVRFPWARVKDVAWR